jgi:hypothetical protein
MCHPLDTSYANTAGIAVRALADDKITPRRRTTRRAGVLDGVRTPPGLTQRAETG